MKLALFLALSYLAGVQGFAIFAPYLVVFLGVAYLMRVRRKKREMAASS